MAQLLHCCAVVVAEVEAWRSVAAAETGMDVCDWTTMSVADATPPPLLLLLIVVVSTGIVERAAIAAADVPFGVAAAAFLQRMAHLCCYCHFHRSPSTGMDDDDSVPCGCDSAFAFAAAAEDDGCAVGTGMDEAAVVVDVPGRTVGSGWTPPSAFDRPRAKREENWWKSCQRSHQSCGADGIGE